MQNSIRKTDWQNILKLLALTFLLHIRDHKQEAEYLIDVSVVLRYSMNVINIQTRIRTFDWYVRNKKELLKIQTGESFENELVSLLKSLRNLPDKTPILNALKSLAIVDDTKRLDPRLDIVAKSEEIWC